MNNHRASRPVLWLTAASLVASATPVLADPPAAPDPGGHAALFYWKAAALLRSPRTPAELDALLFVERDLGVLPPAALVTRPEAARLLLEEGPAMAALGEASQIETLSFPLLDPNSPAPELGHLAMLTRLADRALQTAKAYEYVDNIEGAAGIYVTLLQMAAHLDQDDTLRSGIVGAEILQRVLADLEGFASREPRSSAMTLLTRHLAEVPPPVFHPGRYLQRAAERETRWIAAQPDRIEPRLEMLYAGARHMPALEQLKSLGASQKQERLAQWVTDFRNEIAELAEASSKPYQIGLYEIREKDEAKRKLKEKATGEISNPLVTLLQPTMEQIYERFLLAEGQHVMVDILCATALYRADLKKWPPSLLDVSTFLGRDFPRDPFTGQEMQYRLRKGMPVVAIRAPKWLVQEKNVVHVLDLAARREADHDMAKKFIHELRKIERREKIRERVESMEKEGENDARGRAAQDKP